jgi:hypothetical protein
MWNLQIEREQQVIFMQDLHIKELKSQGMSTLEIGQSMYPHLLKEAPAVNS